MANDPMPTAPAALHLECQRGHRMPYAATDRLVGRNSWREHAGTVWLLDRPCPWCQNSMCLMRGDRPETGLPGFPTVGVKLSESPSQPKPAQPEHLALRIGMGHDINADRVIFKAVSYREGNALRQFEDDLAQIVREEVARQTSDIEVRLANLRGAAWSAVELMETIYDFQGISYPNQVELKRRAKTLRAALAEAKPAPPIQSAEPPEPAP